MKKQTITGAEFAEFYKRNWPAGCWHDDCEYQIEDEIGNFTLPPDAVLDLDRLGFIYEPADGNVREFRKVYEDWLGLNDQDVLMVLRVPKDRASEVRQRVEEIGISIVESADQAIDGDVPASSP